MKRIKVIEKSSGSSLFSIDKYAFKYIQGEEKQMIKYQIELKLPDYDAADMRFLLADIDSNFEFLLTAPQELTNFIKEYEEDNDPSDECLFHDLRTKYVDFIRNKVENEKCVQDELIIVGYSLLKEKIYLVIKAFSLKVVSAFLQKITSYCLKNPKPIEIEAKEDIRWLELNQYVWETNEDERNIGYKDFLMKTLSEENFIIFYRIFQQIDKEGYFGKDFYEEVIFKKHQGKDGKEHRVPISQISKYFAPFWKYRIDINKSKDILCLHDEIPIDEKFDEYVYTFKPGLMKYYLKNWFEDFTTEVIREMNSGSFQVKYILSGKKFNFFCDKNENNIREIDVVLGVEKKSCLKLVAIECKKTLSSKEVQITNKKCREKVINSGNNVFDAFIHIGCFKGDIDFDKQIEGTKEKYKRSVLEGEDDNLDVPYYAFIIKSISDYEMKLGHVLTDVFENW